MGGLPDDDMMCHSDYNDLKTNKKGGRSARADYRKDNMMHAATYRLIQVIVFQCDIAVYDVESDKQAWYHGRFIGQEQCSRFIIISMETNDINS